MIRKTALTTCLLAMLGSAAFATDFETATEAVRNMGLGWNLGNTLEANSQTVTDVSNSNYWGQQDLTSETCWGEYATKPALLKMMKDAGFGAVRVPVTWYNHMNADGQVDAAWMARVREVVDYVVGQGMYCILNVHHDTGADGTGFASWLKADVTHYNSVKTRYENLWRQIAEEFRDYDQHLLFEGYNEMLDSKDSWCYASFNTPAKYDAAIANSAYTAINSYAQSFVNVVRSTGGNNQQRNLIVNTYGACCGTGGTHFKDPLTNLLMPTGEKNHIAFEVHSYPNIENLANAKKEVDNLISTLNANLVSKGAPVIIGEWGTSNVDADSGKTDYDVRRQQMFEFADYFIQKTKASNIATFYWMGLSRGLSRLLPAFDQPDLALRLLQAWHGSDYSPVLPTVADISEINYSCRVNYTSQWAEFYVFKGSISASDYKHLHLELAKAPAAGELQMKVYSTSGKMVAVTARETDMSLAGLGVVTGITLQWNKSATGSVDISNVYLVNAAGKREFSNPGVFWGCYMTDLNIDTGITPITMTSGSGNRVYSLSGLPVVCPSHGLFIRGGKKFVVKSE